MVRCHHNIYSITFRLLLCNFIFKELLLECLCFLFKHAWSYEGFQLGLASMRYAVSLETSNLIKTVVQI